MRIAVVSTAAVRVPPIGYGGTELVLHYLTEGLVRAGHAVTLFATGDSATRGELRFLFAKAVWPIDPLAEIDHAAWSCVEIGRSRAFDVVHLNHAPAIAMARAFGAPVIYTLHHPREEPLSRFYARFPDVRYVAISERQREREMRFPRMHVVHHGLDPADYPGARAPDDYVAFIGRFAPSKGPHLAVDAALRAGVPIRLAGRPHEGEGEAYHAREMVPRLGRPGVIWIGEVGGAAKGDLLARARATLFPVSWEEPFGLVMVESMLSGTPVIAFPRGAAPEVVEDGVTGFLVRDVDEMAAAVARAGRIDRERCRQRARERFDAARMVRDYIDVYTTAIAERRLTGPGSPERRPPLTVALPDRSARRAAGPTSS